MAGLRVMIVDDEPLARRRLEILLRDQDEVELVGAAADGVAARRMIGERSPDVVLLDIKMPGQTGLEVLDALAGTAPIVILVTAFDRFALEAFDRAAFDYLLKPVEPARLAASLARAREALAEHAAAERAHELEEILRNLRSGAAPAQRPAPSNGTSGSRNAAGGSACRWRRLIGWRPSATTSASTPAHAASWSANRSAAWPSAWTPELFVRVHRSSLVRADRIVRVRHAGGRGAVMLSTGAEIPVSRRHMHALKAMTRSPSSNAPDYSNTTA